MADPDLKPRTAGELLDAAFAVYRRQFPRLVLVAVIVSLPALVVATIYADGAAAAARNWTEQVTEFSRTKPDADLDTTMRTLLRGFAELQPYLILSTLLQATERAAGAVTMAFVATAALRRERSPSVGALLATAAPRLPAAILAQVLVDCTSSVCMTCCLPVGIILNVVLSCATVAIALERGPIETSARASVPAAVRWIVQPFVAALDGFVRSARLTMNGPAIARGTLYLFFLFMFVGIADAAASTIARLVAADSGAWFWAQHCAEALLLPVWGLGLALWYTDLRVRREGIDLVAAA